MSPACSVTVVPLAEAEMAPVASLRHTAVVDQPEVDVDLVRAGPPSTENAFSHHLCIWEITGFHVRREALTFNVLNRKLSNFLN